MRLVEVEGRGGQAILEFCRSVAMAAKTNLVGDVGDDAQPLPADGHTVAVDLRPYEIAAVQVELARET